MKTTCGPAATRAAARATAGSVARLADAGSPLVATQAMIPPPTRMQATTSAAKRAPRRDRRRSLAIGRHQSAAAEPDRRGHGHRHERDREAGHGDLQVEPRPER